MNKIGIAIVGAGQVGCHLAEELRNNPASHYRPVCFIDRNKAKIGMRVADLNVYGEDDLILKRLLSARAGGLCGHFGYLRRGDPAAHPVLR